MSDKGEVKPSPPHHPVNPDLIVKNYPTEYRDAIRLNLINYNNYINRVKQERESYSIVPYEYYAINPLIPTFSYVKTKLGLTKEHKLTWQELYKACSLYPEIFAFYMLGLHLRPYQHYDLDMTVKNRYIAKAWSRRLGKSFDNRILLLWSVFFNKFHSDIGGTTWNIILQDQDTGNDIYIEPLHELMERGDRITKSNFRGKLGDKYFTSKLTTPRDKTGKVRANKISFRIPADNITDTREGICRITTYPPTKKAIGHEGNIIGDEVSKWKDNSAVKDEFKFFDQLTAILKDNPSYKAVYSSTPEGANDLFAEIFQPDSPSSRYYRLWLPYYIRFDKVWLDELADTRSEAIRKGRLSLFQQEYEAKFISISNPFFPVNLIMNNIDNSLTNPPTHLITQFYHSLGIDWGGTEKSQTSISIVAWDTKPNSIRYLIYTKTYPINQDLDKFIPDIKNIAFKYNIKWVVPDNKGGRWAIPQLKQIFPGRVEPFNFTTDKKAGYELLRQAFVNNLIAIPPDNNLITQLLSLTDELKPNSSKNKDDMADSLMMAMYSTLNQPKSKFRVFYY